jgi:hypothetical protein
MICEQITNLGTGIVCHTFNVTKHCYRYNQGIQEDHCYSYHGGNKITNHKQPDH